MKKNVNKLEASDFFELFEVDYVLKVRIWGFGVRSNIFFGKGTKRFELMNYLYIIIFLLSMHLRGN